MTTRDVLSDVFVERVRQEEMWGQQNHPDLDPLLVDDCATPTQIALWYHIPTAARAKMMCASLVEEKGLTWPDILIEEVSEAVEAAGESPEALREELVQVAAVAVAWIEAIDRR
jgi:hypothetical protein